jgi:hypothetical protein
MAGRITVSTLNDDTGVLATQNGMTGIAKAWVNFNGVGSATIRTSFNVSSVTRTALGQYTINFTTAMPNANYVQAITAGTSGLFMRTYVNFAGAPTTTAFSILFNNTDDTAQEDPNYVYCAIFSS